jgi:hypothetical protein
MRMTFVDRLAVSDGLLQNGTAILGDTNGSPVAYCRCRLSFTLFESRCNHGFIRDRDRRAHHDRLGR